MSAALGSKAKLMIGATSTVDLPLEFLSESVALSENFIDTAGIRGTRSHTAERVRRGTRQVGGSITMTPNAVELDSLLPWILGTAESTDSFVLGESLLARYVSVDRETKVFLYDNCYVSSATFSASEGSPLQCTVNLMGIDETVNNSGTQPSFTLNVATGPFMMSDCVLTVGGTGYSFGSFELTIDNGLEAKFFNSVTASRFNPVDRTVTWSVSFPYGDASAIYAPAIAGVACIATFTNAAQTGVVLTMTSTYVQTPRQSPTVGGRTEIMLPWTGIARRSGATLELAVTHDSVP